MSDTVFLLGIIVSVLPAVVPVFRKWQNIIGVTTT